MQVNPTRIELIGLKKRLSVALRGHKLLQDKRDELMKGFLPLLKKARSLRQEVEEGIVQWWHLWALSRMVMSPNNINEALMSPKTKLSIKTTYSPPLNNPQFELQGNIECICYGFFETSPYLDQSLSTLAQIFPKMVELAQIEREVILLAEEIERTRRRVNALEYILIPQLEQSIRHISLKLDELERAHLTMLMQVKHE